MSNLGQCNRNARDNIKMENDMNENIATTNNEHYNSIIILLQYMSNKQMT